MSQVRGVMRSQQHTAHTHTTDLKPIIAPIEGSLSVPPLLTSSHKQVATDNIEAPPHPSSSREQGAATNGAEVQSFAPQQPRSLHERVTTDDAEAPRHHHAIRGQPTVPNDLVIVAHGGRPTASVPRHRDTGIACRLRKKRGGQVIPRGK